MCSYIIAYDTPSCNGCVNAIYNTINPITNSEFCFDDPGMIVKKSRKRGLHVISPITYAHSLFEACLNYIKGIRSTDFKQGAQIPILRFNQNAPKPKIMCNMLFQFNCDNESKDAINEPTYAFINVTNIILGNHESSSSYLSIINRLFMRMRTCETYTRDQIDEAEQNIRLAKNLMQYILHPTKYRLCLHSKCNGVMQYFGRNAALHQCMACHTTWCLKCRIEYHHGKSCSESKALMNESDAYVRVIIEYAISRKLMRCCPTCSTAVIRLSGCRHMTCVVDNCNTHWCFGCGAAITTANPYDHFSSSGCTVYPDNHTSEVTMSMIQQMFQKTHYYGALKDFAVTRGQAKNCPECKVVQFCPDDTNIITCACSAKWCYHCESSICKNEQVCLTLPRDINMSDLIDSFTSSQPEQAQKTRHEDNF